MVYEHFHRYAYAADRAPGLRVLDLASGEGYGANVLAARAAQVVGLEIDEVALRHSRDRYQRPNLRFDHGTITDLSKYDEKSFDLVTCFEAIEHVEDQGAVVAGAARLLTDQGAFIVSTPDHDFMVAQHLDNPFHVKEVNRAQFRQLLLEQFPHVEMLIQSVTTGSRLLPEHDRASEVPGRDYFARRGVDGWELCEPELDPYLVAVASRSRLVDVGRSHLHDIHRELAWRPVDPDLHLSEEGLSPLEVERRILLRRLSEAYDEVAYWKGKYVGLVNTRAWRAMEKALRRRQQVKAMLSRAVSKAGTNEG